MFEGDEHFGEQMALGRQSTCGPASKGSTQRPNVARVGSEQASHEALDSKSVRRANPVQGTRPGPLIVEATTARGKT